MSDDILRVRLDGYSYQITSAHSPHFFVRITSPQEDHAKIVFSDFLMAEDDETRAIQALELISRSFQLSAGVKVEILDILPGKDPTVERDELIRRHDRFVKLFRVFGRGVGSQDRIKYEVKNSYLEPRAGKYSTIIITSSC